jgi:hypothetical protein
MSDDPREALRDYMMDLCEALHGCGWVPDWERDLWLALNGANSPAPGRRLLTREERTHLHALVKAAGGWWAVAPTGELTYVDEFTWRRRQRG